MSAFQKTKRKTMRHFKTVTTIFFRLTITIKYSLRYMTSEFPNSGDGDEADSKGKQQ
jgi:hypothetical protein